MSNVEKDPVSTTVTSFGILDVLRSVNGATVSEVAEELGVAVSTAHRHLSTLVDEGFVVREGRQYDVGLRFLDYGVYARNRLRYYEIAKNQVDTLVDETGEKVRLTAFENDHCVLLYRRMGDHPLVTSADIGDRRPPHQLAAGKAILAALPPEQAEAVVDRTGLPARTDATVTDRGELLDQLERIRDRGYALNRGEAIEGLNAVGVAFRDGDGRPIGALSVAGPANRLRGSFLTEELPGRLLGAVNEVEINLKYARNPAWG